MSTSDLYILNRKSTTHFAAFRNGYGSAPRCWDFLGEKYIPEKPIYSMDMDHLKKVWALTRDKRVTTPEKIALMLTFDRAYVPIAGLKNAGEACLEFGKACENGKSENHWPAIGEALLRAANMKHHYATRGICLSPTSVSDCWLDPSRTWLADAWSIFEEEV